MDGENSLIKATRGNRAFYDEVMEVFDKIKNMFIIEENGLARYH